MPELRGESNNISECGGVELFSTCPASEDADPSRYLQMVENAASWSEQAGCTGMLVYSDNRQMDAWLVSQVIAQATRTLSPLVAVQPVYMHPYTVAKNIWTLSRLYDRRIYLNMVAGGFKNDLIALNDPTPHDERYARLIEYTTIVMRLLASAKPVTFSGRYYSVSGLKMEEALPEALQPKIFISGSSAAGIAAAEAMGATAISHPKPAGECERARGTTHTGIRVGVIARESEERAWAYAYQRFPRTRAGELKHQLAAGVSDSHWFRDLSEAGDASTAERSVYWLAPFETYQSMCPYLVGAVDSVAGALREYIALGHRVFIADIPSCAADIEQARRALDAAMEADDG